MPTISLSSDIHYFYMDSGMPDTLNYETVIILHGHTYHGAIFESIFSPSFDAGLRVIAVNRRGYPHSSPFTPSEIDTMTSPTAPQAHLEALFVNHATNLAHALDKIATESELPKGKNITIAGWSNGGIFALGIVAFLNDDASDDGMREVRERLRAKVKGLILWDPPTVCFGVPVPADVYVPLYDESIPPEARGPAFGVWVASYFKHKSVTSHSSADLQQHTPLTEPTPSVTRMSPSQLVAMTDLAGGGVWDTGIVSPRFMEVYERQAQKVLLGESRKGLGTENTDMNVYVLVGDANPGPVISGMWVVEDMMKLKAASQNERSEARQKVGFKIMHGANHFVFWDNPKVTVDVLRECIAGDMRNIVVDPVAVVVRQA